MSGVSSVDAGALGGLVGDTLAELGLAAERLGGLVGDSADGLDHASDRLAVHGEHRAGRGLEEHLVLLVVDREDRAEDAEVGHHLGARLHLGLQLLGVGLTLARVAEHEEDQHRQDGEHDDSERIERHEGEVPSGVRRAHEVRRR